jgi:hypothetical protein
MVKCLCCGLETDNPKFCSRACAAKYNNTHFPKRKTKKVCIVCSQPVKSYRHNRCEVHWLQYKENQFKNKTIGEYRMMPSVMNKHPSWLHAHVRGFARSWLKHLTTQPCRHCGYDKHVELAHITAVSSYHDDVLLSDINSEKNVIPLCPNCHWEFDNLPRYVID